MAPAPARFLARGESMTRKARMVGGGTPHPDVLAARPTCPLTLPLFHGTPDGAGLCLPATSLLTPQGGSRMVIFSPGEQPERSSQSQRTATRSAFTPLGVPSNSCQKPTFPEATPPAERPAPGRWEEGAEPLSPVSATGLGAWHLLAPQSAPRCWTQGWVQTSSEGSCW